MNMGDSPVSDVAPLALSLSISSSLTLASATMAAIGRLLTELLGDERGERFALACTEAVNNAIIHAHGRDAEQIVSVSLQVSNNEITASIIDQGEGLALSERLAALPENPYESESEMPESGLGLWLIRRGADRVEYLRDATGNRLVLTLRLHS